jgi:hypothetical protein
VNRDWTLNLGLRWDYYGVPWVSDGLTVSQSVAAMRCSATRVWDSIIGCSPASVETTPSHVRETRPPNPNVSVCKDHNNLDLLLICLEVPWFSQSSQRYGGIKSVLGRQPQYVEWTFGESARQFYDSL